MDTNRGYNLKKYFTSLLLPLLLAVDVYITYELLFLESISNRDFWFYHILTTITILLLNKFFFKRDLLYFDLLMLILPCLGVTAALFIGHPNGDKDYFAQIESSMKLETYLDSLEADNFLNIQVELGTMSAYDYLFSSTSSQEKRDFLIKFRPDTLKFRVEVLKKALSDSDPEVVHYAATELNTVEEGFFDRIKAAEDEKDAYNLLGAYIEYIESELLDGPILKIYQNKTLELIEMLTSPSDNNFLYYFLKKLEILKVIGKGEDFIDACHMLFKDINDNDFEFKAIYNNKASKDDNYLMLQNDILQLVMEFFYQEEIHEHVIRIRKLLIRSYQKLLERKRKDNHDDGDLLINELEDRIGFLQNQFFFKGLIS